MIKLVLSLILFILLMILFFKNIFEHFQEKTKTKTNEKIPDCESCTYCDFTPKPQHKPYIISRCLKQHTISSNNFKEINENCSSHKFLSTYSGCKDALKYYSKNILLGRGNIFHIAPSNVPMNFAYSLAFGLLSGNNNIVRIPSRNFFQVDILCKIFKKVILIILRH